ncbi:MAG: ExeM/NucH family extracellular endonuclease, partial [Bacteroidales bacterium]
ISAQINKNSEPVIVNVALSAINSDIKISIKEPFSLIISNSGNKQNSITISASDAKNLTNISIQLYFTPNENKVYKDTLFLISGTIKGFLAIEGFPITPIYQIQGKGAMSEIINTQLYTSGIITADFCDKNKMGGFFIQDASGDNDSTTSDAIFVVYPDKSITIGQEVLLQGTVEEKGDRTQLKNVIIIESKETKNIITPYTVLLPIFDSNKWEQYEGMLVTFSKILMVTNTDILQKSGTISLAPFRTEQPTNSIDPNDSNLNGNNYSGASNKTTIDEKLKENNANTIFLDDNTDITNPTPIPYTDKLTNSLRCGSQVIIKKGIIDQPTVNYRVRPVDIEIIHSSKPSIPDVGNYQIKIAGFNVYNYFNGNGTGIAGAAGGFPTIRGAETLEEFQKQKTKLISMIVQLNADILGICEMENDGDGSLSAIADLVKGINSILGTDMYAYIKDPQNSEGGTGKDDVKNSIIYNKTTVTPLNNSFSDVNYSGYSRMPIAQTFKLKNSSESFTVVVNHFKSKLLQGATGDDADQNDGQGPYNFTRKEQAHKLCSFLQTIPNKTGNNNIVILGDFNAYFQEDPIDIIRSYGYSTVLENHYTYNHAGLFGALDHIFATNDLKPSISGSAVWHINADEPAYLDFKTTLYFSPDQFRCSDHDPVLLGLNFQKSDYKISDKTNSIIKFVSYYKGNIIFAILPTNTNSKVVCSVVSNNGFTAFKKEFNITNDQFQYVINNTYLASGIWYFIAETQNHKSVLSFLVK